MWRSTSATSYEFFTKQHIFHARPFLYFQSWHDIPSYARSLQRCIAAEDLPQGRSLHAKLIQTGFMMNPYLQTKTLILYSKIGRLEDARQLFGEIPKKNVVSWTTMISAYATKGFPVEALQLFSQMQTAGIDPDQFTLSTVLPLCGILNHGRLIHRYIIVCGFKFDEFVASALVHMYAKFGKTLEASRVFGRMDTRDTVLINVMILGYLQSGFVDKALDLFWSMPLRDTVSWNTVIAGFIHNGCIDMAEEFFEKIPARNSVTWSTMIAGYGQFGYLNEAVRLFHQMPVHDCASWNGLISAHIQCGLYTDALGLFREFMQSGLIPNSVNFATIINACRDLKALRVLHGIVIRRVMGGIVLVGNALVNMYSKCMRVDDAAKILRRMIEPDIASWTCLIVGYSKHGLMDMALDIFHSMPQRNVVTWNAMIGGLSQHGFLDQALSLFYEMPERDVVSWNTMIGGCTQNGQPSEALNLFREMQQHGLKPDSATFTSLLPAVSSLSALDYGMSAHGFIFRKEFESDIFLNNALVDMYAKCGNLGDSRKLFMKMPRQDASSWNSLIEGYGIHGFGEEGIGIFKEMQHSMVLPNEATFVAVLTACCHAGSLAEGWKYFYCMMRDYQIKPTSEHYCCMVDLLCHFGLVDEAYRLVNRMRINPNEAIWKSLVGCCKNFWES